MRSVVVTSATKGEGKTTVAWNLAAAAASAGSRVVLVEADMRNPELASGNDTEMRPGLPEVISGVIEAEAAMHRVSTGLQESHAGTDGSRPPTNGANGEGAGTSAVTTLVPSTGRDAQDSPGFDVLPCGRPPANPTDFAQSNRMRDLMTSLEERYDLVVIDTPAITEVADAIPLATRAGGVLIVTRLGSALRGEAQRAAAELQGLNAPLLGVVAVQSANRLAGQDDGAG